MAFTKTKKEFINIMEGKENISIPDLLKKYPKGIHITGASVIKAKKGDCSAWIFSEDEGKFFFGGKVFTESLKEWIAEKGSTAAVNEELKTDMPVFIITACTNKNGDSYYDFEIK